MALLTETGGPDVISVLDILTLECWAASRWRCQVEAGNLDLVSGRRRQGWRHSVWSESFRQRRWWERGGGQGIGGEEKEREGVREESRRGRSQPRDRRKKRSLRGDSHRSRSKSRRK